MSYILCQAEIVVFPCPAATLDTFGKIESKSALDCINNSPSFPASHFAINMAIYESGLCGQPRYQFSPGRKYLSTVRAYWVLTYF